MRSAKYIDSHKSQMKRIDAETTKLLDKVKDLDHTDQIDKAMRSGEYQITSDNNRWGIPLNETQEALIHEFRLEHTARPAFYNRATTKQRMLEAILSEPNPNFNFIERLHLLREGAPVVFNPDLQYISDNISEYSALDPEGKESREGDLALSRAFEAYGNIFPVGVREKARTWRYVSMLLSVPSAARNVIGNSSQNILNATAHGVAVELDRIVSRFTKERTMAHLSVADRVEGWQAYMQETANTFKDYFVDRVVTERGENRYNYNNKRGRVYQNALLEGMRNIEGFLMSFGDRNFWRKAYINSIAEQLRVADLNGTEVDIETGLAQAEADANFATFSEDNVVKDAFSALKRTPIVGDVLDFIIPFTGVPTNIIKRMWQFSPAGLASSAIRHAYRGLSGQDFLQQEFVNSMSRGLTGTAMFAIGMALREMGVIDLGTGSDEDDREYAMRTAQGGQYSPFIRLGDENISLSPFAPAASAMIMGATAFDLFREDDDKLSALYNSCLAGLDQIFDASYMSSLQDIFQGQGSTAENIGQTVLNSAISQSVPSILSQLAMSMDGYVRDTKDSSMIMQALKSGLIQKLPYLREQLLPEKVDVAGNPVESKQGLRNFFDPMTTSKVNDDPALAEMLRLYESTGSSAHMPSDALSGSRTALNGVEAPVEGKDKETYKKRYGELWRLGGTTYDEDGNRVTVQGVSDLIRSDAYQSMTDEEKASALKSIVSAAKTGAVYETRSRLDGPDRSETTVTPKDDSYEKKPPRAMPERFANSESELLGRLADLYEQTGDGTFIPKGISNEFTSSGTKYSLKGEDYEALWDFYEEELESKLREVDWDADTADVADQVTGAYSSAASAARKRYLKTHK